METVKVYKITVMEDGQMKAKMRCITLSIPFQRICREMQHYGFKTVKDVVTRWDIYGKSFNTSRYFLISPNADISGRLVGR